MERVVILQALVLFLIFAVFWGLSGKAFLFYGKKCIAQAERGGSAEKGAGRLRIWRLFLSSALAALVALCAALIGYFRG